MKPDEPQIPDSADFSSPSRNQPADRLANSSQAEAASSASSASSGQPLQPLIIPTGTSVGNVGDAASSANSNDSLTRRVADLQQQEKTLKQEIAALQSSYNAMLQRQITEAQTAIGRLVQEGVSDLEQRKQTLQLAIEQLERRQERIKTEMRTTFAGSSQELAMRVQGFKDYLTGSLQDLVVSAEQLQLTPTEAPPRPAAQPAFKPEFKSESVREGRESSRESSRESAGKSGREAERASDRSGANRSTAGFTESGFVEQAKRIRMLLDQYRASPDYYGPPWQLRRTFEPVHADRITNWFFSQAGRGAIRTMGSRLQNILIASAAISVLNELYGERLRPLILGNSPERLGEWRRGLQDCLGVSRADFGIDEGIVLFESPEALAQRAERLVKQKQLPLIIIDETEEYISVALLQFPLWLAFAPDPNVPGASF
ncbi:MAG: DUF3086 domain-containing protein [Pegethrix bostrychoides GSE-TBD4-15B]|jgi:Skp family chaperone for outer membrane proteins|uniref:DUF3086 domain-containing protein n=1 Tax=Pegethrix bostrychoides GSE-TBD4-15B TaxID=2839662 RepID=A0A951P9W8_9CYAN|nr:DUF3086 domain-containing protein [Pegethrix bostrychoides GSE-TBD4-15B]